MAEYNPLLRQLFNIKFPVKLWILINSEHPAIKWDNSREYVIASSSSSSQLSLSSSIIAIDCDLLENYLKSKISIFVAKESSTFFIEMEKYNFKKLPQIQLNSINSQNDGKISKIFKFYHEMFLNGQPELLSKIVKTKEILSTDNLSNGGDVSNKIRKAELCLKLAVRPPAVAENLTRKLSKYDEQGVEIIEIPSECFLNPYDTASNFEEKSEYAGFYGQYVNEQKIKKFYDEFIPKYAETNGHEIVDKENNNNWQTVYDIPEQQLQQSTYSGNVENEPYVESVKTNVSHTGTSNSNLSFNINQQNQQDQSVLTDGVVATSTNSNEYIINFLSGAEADQNENANQEIIEPIFVEENLENKVNTEEIFMEDYLKFNEPSASLTNSIIIDDVKIENEIFFDVVDTENANQTEQQNSIETILSKSMNILYE